MKNLFKKQSAKFVQNPSSDTKVMAKHILVFFLCPTVYLQVLLIMINMFCPTSYLIPIITFVISGLGDMNLHWRLKAMLEPFLKDRYSKT